MEVVRRCDDSLESTRIRFPDENETPFRSFPASFHADYPLPEHRERLLSMTNVFPSFDSKIEFFEEPHLYRFNKKIIATASVSGLLKPYKSAFQPHVIIPGMLRSKHYPKLKYAVNAKVVTDERELELDSKVIIHNAVVDEHVFTGCFGDAPPRSDEDVLYTFDRGMTHSEIVEMWDSPEARNLGTEGHLALENFFNGEATWKTKELEAGLVFAREIMAKHDIVGHRCEFEIYCDEEDLAGSIDFLAKSKNSDQFHIFDWKRAKNLQDIFPKKFAKKLKPPFDSFVESDVPVYTFQLSAYMYALEKYGGIKIQSLALVSIMPDKSWWTFVPYLREETEWLMRKRRELVAARIVAADLRPDLPRCELSGAVAFDAVRSEDGRIFNEAYHKLHKTSLPPATPDWAPRNAVRAVIDSVRQVRVSNEEKALVAKNRPFKSYFPETGVQQMKFCRSF